MGNLNYKNGGLCLFVFKRGMLKEQADKLVADHSFYQKEEKKLF